MTAALDEAALANLTPEEREAFNDSEYSDQEKESLKALAAAAPDDETEDEGDPDEVLDADGKPVEVPAKTDDGKPATEPAAEPAKAEETPKPAPVVETETTYRATLPEDFDAKVKELRDKTAELRAKFKAGDMEFDDYEAQLGEIVTERENLNIARAKAEISQEMSRQSVEAQFNRAIDRVSSLPADQGGGINYRGDAKAMADFNAFLRVLGNDPDNSNQDANWFVTEAHKRVQALRGVAATPASQLAPEDVKKAAAARRAPPTAAIPKTIANVPGGAGPGDIGGEFAQLDALSGNDLEVAIAKMTPAQREKYARGL